MLNELDAAGNRKAIELISWYKHFQMGKTNKAATWHVVVGSIPHLHVLTYQRLPLLQL